MIGRPGIAYPISRGKYPKGPSYKECLVLVNLCKVGVNVLLRESLISRL
jgi:hypothetical protein